METKTIISAVDRLHAEAALKIRGIPYRYQGKSYLFDFNGSGVEVRQDGQRIATFNTRKLSTAKQWLREWLAN